MGDVNMIKINLVVVGKVKEKYFTEAIEEYSKRLSRFCKLEIIEVKEENFTDNPSKSEIELIKEKEAENILKKIDGKVYLTYIGGKKYSSESFSKKISSSVDKGENLTFVIGGSYGVSQKVVNCASELVSFSDMTFPHTLFRVMLLEQIYRAFKIKENSRYHK